jgi:hypothetical protein
VTPPSTSHPDQDAPAWLQAQVYAPRRQRTLDRVRRAVDTLVTAQQPVSLASIAAMSKALDPQGRGISTSAILGNVQARAYYERHRRWTPVRHRRGSPVPSASANLVRPHISLSRDLTRARQRYLRLAKSVLVERLLALEHAYAEQEERWLRVNDELLTWQLGAELRDGSAPNVAAHALPVLTETQHRRGLPSRFAPMVKTTPGSCTTGARLRRGGSRTLQRRGSTA